jgi:hypothetical protein
MGFGQPLAYLKRHVLGWRVDLSVGGQAAQKQTKKRQAQDLHKSVHGC